MHTIGHWIDGKATVGASERVGPVYDPATGVQTASVALASSDEVADVVGVSAAAAAEWSPTSLSSRAAALFRLRELVDRHRAELAALVTAEHGKVLSDAAGEVARGLENVEFACAIPHLLKGSYSTEVSAGVDVHTVLQPLGVVAGITPFNSRSWCRCGCSPMPSPAATHSSSSPRRRTRPPSLLLAELVQQAGMPDGVFNVVQGDGEAVDALLAHPGVAAVSFVGSTPVARHIYETGTKAGSESKRSVGPRTTWWYCPTPSRCGCRCRRLGWVRLGR